MHFYAHIYKTFLLYSICPVTSTVNPEKLAKLNELEKAREKIKQEIISADKSPDNSVLYTAITKFKKRNG